MGANGWVGIFLWNLEGEYEISIFSKVKDAPGMVSWKKYKFSSISTSKQANWWIQKCSSDVG